MTHDTTWGVPRNGVSFVTRVLLPRRPVFGRDVLLQLSWFP
jgi:hypothetical protein